MPVGDKRLERKEMRVQKGKTVYKFRAEEAHSSGKEMEKRFAKRAGASLPASRACLRAKEPGLQTSEQGVRSRGGPLEPDPLGGFVGYGVELTVAQVNRLGLGPIERACATPAKNGELIAGFIHGAVALDSFGDGQRRASQTRGGDQLGRRARAEAGEMRGVVPGGNDFEDAQAIFAVRDKSKHARRDHSKFHVVHVVELASGIKHLVEFGSVRLFHVDNC